MFDRQNNGSRSHFPSKRSMVNCNEPTGSRPHQKIMSKGHHPEVELLLHFELFSKRLKDSLWQFDVVNFIKTSPSLRV
jgi:hypothetical protein